MKKQELIKIIETVVRKEVKKQMNEIFIKEETSSKLIDIVPDVSELKEEIQYTKNKSLNCILHPWRFKMGQKICIYTLKKSILF